MNSLSIAPERVEHVLDKAASKRASQQVYSMDESLN